MARDYHDVRMGEFAPLHAYLVTQKGGATVALSFERIEEILGFELPGEARTKGIAWWTILPKVPRARSWLAASRRPQPRPDGIDFVHSEYMAYQSDTGGTLATEIRLDHALDRLRYPSSGDMDREISDGWWEPHVVYVIRYGEAGVLKVGLTHARSRRVETLARIGGYVVQLLEVPNRWVATAVESTCLLEVSDARAEPPLWIAQVAGATEFWREETPPPVLADLLARIRLNGYTLSWDASISRSGVRAVQDH